MDGNKGRGDECAERAGQDGVDGGGGNQSAFEQRVARRSAADRRFAATGIGPDEEEAFLDGIHAAIARLELWRMQMIRAMEGEPHAVDADDVSCFRMDRRPGAETPRGELIGPEVRSCAGFERGDDDDAGDGDGGQRCDAAGSADDELPPLAHPETQQPARQPTDWERLWREMEEREAGRRRDEIEAADRSDDEAIHGGGEDDMPLHPIDQLIVEMDQAWNDSLEESAREAFGEQCARLLRFSRIYSAIRFWWLRHGAAEENGHGA